MKNYKEWTVGELLDKGYMVGVSSHFNEDAQEAEKSISEITGIEKEHQRITETLHKIGNVSKHLPGHFHVTAFYNKKEESENEETADSI